MLSLYEQKFESAKHKTSTVVQSEGKLTRSNKIYAYVTTLFISKIKQSSGNFLLLLRHEAVPITLFPNIQIWKEYYITASNQ